MIDTLDRVGGPPPWIEDGCWLRHRLAVVAAPDEAVNAGDGDVAPDAEPQNLQRRATEDEGRDVDVGIEDDAERSASGAMLLNEPFDVSRLDAKLSCLTRAIRV
jgi:hypothetical protein